MSGQQWPRRVGLGLVLVTALVVALAAGLLVRGEFASGSSTATVRIGSGQLPPGGTDVTRVDLLNVTGVAALTVDITYDTAVKDATACDPVAGHPFDSLLCAVHPLGIPNVVRLTGIDATGVTGADIDLVDITWQALGAPGTSTALMLSVTTYADADGNPITPPLVTQNGTNSIATPSPTPTPTATPTPTPTPSPTPTPVPPRVRIGSGAAMPGDTDTVPLDALNLVSPGVSAVTVDVTYDPTVKTATACGADPQNRFDSALCNLHYHPDTIRLTAISSTGVTGSPRLADITFEASGTLGDCTTLDLTVPTFADPDGNPIAVTTQDGTNCVGTPTPTPSPTPTPTASPTRTPTPTPTPGPDDDGDGLPNNLDPCPTDDDCDDDGLMDGAASSEDLNNNGIVDPGETDPENWDSDGDGLSDGLERGLTAPEGDDTNTASPHWQVDADPSTQTDPLSADTDGDSVPDGQEDANHNGRMDAGETDAALVASSLALGWSQTCYVGDSATVDQALGSAGSKVLAVYRLGATQTFDRWFPGRPDVSTIVTVAPFDQLFVLASEAVTWDQQFSGASQGSATMAQGWNAVCYSGSTTDMNTATAGIADDVGVIYSLASDQSWERYVPGRPEVSDMAQSERLQALLVLVTAEEGATWIFNP